MIQVIGASYKEFNFPCGEKHFVFDEIRSDKIAVIFNYESNAELIDLMLMNDALNRAGAQIHTLKMPYVPYGRQDRVNQEGEPLSIKVLADIINSLNIEVVQITDPHSDVTTALLDNCQVAHQHHLFAKYLKDKKGYWLISPDAGALKKIYKLAAKVTPLGVIEFSKQRNTLTGEIIGVSCGVPDFNHADCYIVDDICDGGRTFVEISKVLKERKAGKIILMVSHGFFTKGLEVFDGLIDEIYTREGKVK